MRHKTLGVIYLDEDNIVKFGLSNSVPTQVSGIDLLLQKVVMVLFTDPGSNGFANNLGGGLYQIIGGDYNEDTIEILQNDFASSFETVTSQIKNEQSEQTNLSPSETLVSIDLRSIEYNQYTQTWDIIARVVSAAGLSRDFTIQE